jgi:hypothetical protein
MVGYTMMVNIKELLKKTALDSNKYEECLYEMLDVIEELISEDIDCDDYLNEE